MNLRLTIARKIGLGFGLFILVVIVLFYITNRTLRQSQRINDHIALELTPALKLTEQLSFLVTRSEMLIHKWVYVQTREDDPDKLKLLYLQNQLIPDQLDSLEKHNTNWTPDQQASFVKIKNDLSRLTLLYEEAERQLPDFASYTDPGKTMQIYLLFDERGKAQLLTQDIQEEINLLTQLFQHTIKRETQDMNQSIDRVQFIMANISWIVCLLGVLIAFITIRSFRKPLVGLKKSLLYLGRGMTPKNEVPVSKDEIGDMTAALKRLISGFNRTKSFSRELERGNFEAEYEPLSESDELGKALLKMRDSLAHNERTLERTVAERTSEVVQQKEIVERQKEQVTGLYKDLTASINYAKRIQQTILPDEHTLQNALGSCFVFFKPKDIVSGDFYWTQKFGNKRYWATVDCTGHGVPGAFMSLMGYYLLNQSIKYETEPGAILNELHRLSQLTLRRPEAGRPMTNDGMDITLCCYDEETKQLSASGAHNPAYVIRNGTLHELEATKLSIGDESKKDQPFSTRRLDCVEGDVIYTFTDGFADQFGGEKGKKFMKRNFRQLLLDISELSMEDQLHQLTSTLVRWKGQYQQVDDILVFACKIE